MNTQEKLEHLYSTSTVNVNGIITNSKEAKISVFDRGFLYGDSIYEVTYSDQGNLIFFEDHLDRLFNSADLLGMDIFLTRTEIIDEALKTLKKSKILRAYIRIIITRGETDIGLDPTGSFKNNFIIIVRPQSKYPEEMYIKGLKLKVSSVLRNDVRAVNPNAKSGNYLNNVMAIKEAKTMGYDDAIMVNKDGFITEGTTFNIWIVKDGVIKTPPSKSGLLKGITRAKVLEICEKNSFSYSTDSFTVNELYEAQEVFITSSTKGIMPVRQVDSKSYGESVETWPIQSKLKQIYNSYIETEIKEQKFNYL